MQDSRSVTFISFPTENPAQLACRQHEQLNSMKSLHDTSRTDPGQDAAGSMDSAACCLGAILVREADRGSSEPLTLKLSVCGQAAVEQLNGMEMNGCCVEVEPAHGAPGGADRHSARSASIFVKGFGPEASLSNLEESVLRVVYSHGALKAPQMQIRGAKHTRSNASSPSSEEWVTQIYRIDNMSCLRGCKPT